MKVLKQLAIICGLCLLGEWIAGLLPFAFPGSVMAMLLTLVLLLLRWIKEKDIKETGDFLLGNMAFFFIPSAVAIIEQLDAIRGQVVALVLISIICTILTLIVTYYTVLLVTKWMKGGKGE